MESPWRGSLPTTRVLVHKNSRSPAKTPYFDGLCRSFGLSPVLEKNRGQHHFDVSLCLLQVADLLCRFGACCLDNRLAGRLLSSLLNSLFRDRSCKLACWSCLCPFVPGLFVVTACRRGDKHCRYCKNCKNLLHKEMFLNFLILICRTYICPVPAKIVIYLLL